MSKTMKVLDGPHKGDYPVDDLNEWLVCLDGEIQYNYKLESTMANGQIGVYKLSHTNGRSSP